MSYYLDESGRARATCLKDNPRFAHDHFNSKIDFMIQGIKDRPDLDKIGISLVQKSLFCDSMYAFAVLGELKKRGYITGRDEQGKHTILREKLK